MGMSGNPADPPAGRTEQSAIHNEQSAGSKVAQEGRKRTLLDALDGLTECDCKQLSKERRRVMDVASKTTK